MALKDYEGVLAAAIGLGGTALILSKLSVKNVVDTVAQVGGAVASIGKELAVKGGEKVLAIMNANEEGTVIFFTIAGVGSTLLSKSLYIRLADFASRDTLSQFLKSAVIFAAASSVSMASLYITMYYGLKVSVKNTNLLMGSQFNGTKPDEGKLPDRKTAAQDARNSNIISTLVAVLPPSYITYWLWTTTGVIRESLYDVFSPFYVDMIFALAPAITSAGYLLAPYIFYSDVPEVPVVPVATPTEPPLAPAVPAVPAVPTEIVHDNSTLADAFHRIKYEVASSKNETIAIPASNLPEELVTGATKCIAWDKWVGYMASAGFSILGGAAVYILGKKGFNAMRAVRARLAPRAPNAVPVAPIAQQLGNVARQMGDIAGDIPDEKALLVESVATPAVIPPTDVKIQEDSETKLKEDMDKKRAAAANYINDLLSKSSVYIRATLLSARSLDEAKKILLDHLKSIDKKYQYMSLSEIIKNIIIQTLNKLFPNVSGQIEGATAADIIMYYFYAIDPQLALRFYPKKAAQIKRFADQLADTYLKYGVNPDGTPILPSERDVDMELFYTIPACFSNVGPTISNYPYCSQPLDVITPPDDAPEGNLRFAAPPITDYVLMTFSEYIRFMDHSLGIVSMEAIQYYGSILDTNKVQWLYDAFKYNKADILYKASLIGAKTYTTSLEDILIYYDTVDNCWIGRPLLWKSSGPLAGYVVRYYGAPSDIGIEQDITPLEPPAEPWTDLIPAEPPVPEAPAVPWTNIIPIVAPAPEAPIDENATTQLAKKAGFTSQMSLPDFKETCTAAGGFTTTDEQGTVCKPAGIKAPKGPAVLTEAFKSDIAPRRERYRKFIYDGAGVKDAPLPDQRDYVADGYVQDIVKTAGAGLGTVEEIGGSTTLPRSKAEGVYLASIPTATGYLNTLQFKAGGAAGLVKKFIYDKESEFKLEHQRAGAKVKNVKYTDIGTSSVTYGQEAIKDGKTVAIGIPVFRANQKGRWIDLPQNSMVVSESGTPPIPLPPNRKLNYLDY